MQIQICRPFRISIYPGKAGVNCTGQFEGVSYVRILAYTRYITRERRLPAKIGWPDRRVKGMAYLRLELET